MTNSSFPPFPRSGKAPSRRLSAKDAARRKRIDQEDHKKEAQEGNPGFAVWRDSPYLLRDTNWFPCPRTHRTQVSLLLGSLGAIGALMNRVLQPRRLVVFGLNVLMGNAAGADELVEILHREFCPGPRRTPFIHRRVLSRKRAK